MKSLYKNLVIPFGKHSGKTLEVLPLDYLDWGSRTMKGRWSELFQMEIERRKRSILKRKKRQKSNINHSVGD